MEFDFGDFTITKREIIASITIVCFMFIIGILISGKIEEWVLDQNQQYLTATKIDSPDLFSYGMRTNSGNAFVYGDLKAVDPVSFDEIDGEYFYIKKTEEHYNMHTRTVTKTRTVNGKTQTYTDVEIYYSWDYYQHWDQSATKVNFCGTEFDISKINLPGAEHIKTIGGLGNVQYVYTGVPNNLKGTIFTRLADNTISDNSNFYKDWTIEQTVESLTTDISVFIFWTVWIVIIGFCVYGFYRLDNYWLE